jgi:hypothetical protein
VTTQVPRTYNNIVALPVGGTKEIASTFTRTSADGSIPCYVNPSSDLSLNLTSGTISERYLGTVKAYSTNNATSTSRQVISKDEKLLPAKFNVVNGLIKLEVLTDGVKFYYYNGSTYVELNKFTFGTIGLVKTLECTPERYVFQTNRVKWTILQGKPFVYVEHSGVDLGFTRRSCYYSDGSTTTDPAADATIAMSTQYYCNIWNRGSGTCASPSPTDNYRMQIMKTLPTSIKSDKIPASALSGIGFYNNTEISTSYNYYEKLALEWFTKTKQSLQIKRS